MKRILLIVIVAVVLSFGAAGCPEWLVGAGAGMATQETLQSWQDNLEAKQIELQAKYEAAEKAIAEAPDPNTLALSTAKRDALRSPMIANEAALITLRSALKAKSEEPGSQGRADAVATGAIGLIALAIREWQKRTLTTDLSKTKTKYASMKLGQAKLKLANPEAEKQLYALTGEARSTLGL